MRWRASARTAVVWPLDRMPDRWFRGLRARIGAHRADGSSVLARSTVRLLRHRRLPEPAFHPAGRDDLTFAATDSWMTRVLYWDGVDAYEGAEAEYWERACRRATNIVELGANIGYYTVIGALANPTSRYRAYEPHPMTAAATRRNLALNSIAHVEVVEAAVIGSPDSRVVELSTPSGDRHGLPAQAFVRAGSEGVEGVVARETHSVEAVTINDIIDGVDLLKIDIEGQEAEVLEPIVDRLIESGTVLFVEVRLAHVPRLRQVLVDLVDGGYLAFAIGAESLHLLPRAELASDGPLPRYGSRDLILVKATDAHLL